MPFFFIIVVIVVIIFAGRYQSKAADESWERAASLLGLSFHPGGLFAHRQMTGRYKGCRVEVDTYTQRSGKHSQTYTRYQVDFPSSLRLGLRLTEQGFLSSISKVFGAQDIEVGNVAFDSSVIIKGADSERIRRFFTTHMQKTVGRLFAGRNGLTVSDHKISWSRRGLERDSGNLTQTVRQFVDAAIEMTSAPVEETPIPIDIDEPAGESVVDDHAATKSALLAAFREKEEKSRVEWPHVVGVPEEKEKPAKKDTFSDPFAREAAPAPSPPPPPAYRPEPEPEPVIPREPEKPAPAPVAAAADTLELSKVSERIFASSETTFSRMKMFEEEFNRALVRGVGTLKKAEKYSYDFALGNRPGCKVTITISKAEAILALPESEYETLKDARGREVGFQGTLVKLDTFPARLYVADATRT